MVSRPRRLRRLRVDVHQGCPGRPRRRGAARHRPAPDHPAVQRGGRRPGRVRRLSRGARAAHPAPRGPRRSPVLGRWRPADRGGRQRRAGHRRSRTTGRAVQRRQGGAGAGRRARRGQARRAPRGAQPDVVLLVGGTDGGNASSSSGTPTSCRVLPGPGRWWSPATSRRDGQVGRSGCRAPYVLADNVVPRIGVLAPESARRAIREVFLSHVIGGKHLSRRAADSDRFAAMVLGATPDVVLTGVELLAAAHGSTVPGSGVVVVDVGGATTDVHSVVVLDPEDGGLSREVVAATPVTRTVEGDLGMRWSAGTTGQAAAGAGLGLPLDAVRRAADPAYLRDDANGRSGDVAIASAAPVVAMRRHVGRSRVVISPRAGSSSAPARTCVRSTCWSPRGGCSGRATPRRPTGSLAATTGDEPGRLAAPRAPPDRRRPRLRAGRGRSDRAQRPGRRSRAGSGRAD